MMDFVTNAVGDVMDAGVKIGEQLDFEHKKEPD